MQNLIKLFIGIGDDAGVLCPGLGSANKVVPKGVGIPRFPAKGSPPGLV